MNMDARVNSIKQVVAQLIRLLDRKPERAGLKLTPDTAAETLSRLTRCAFDADVGPAESIFEHAERVTTTGNVAKSSSWVLGTAMPVVSLCERRLLPFFGVMDIAYVPKAYTVNVERLTLLSASIMLRLQSQLSITTSMADQLQKGLEPFGVAVRVRCQHILPDLVGLGTTTTVHATGDFKRESAMMSRFIQLVDGGAV